jgi:tetratricopeptide (TPR) repeat protein
MWLPVSGIVLVSNYYVADRYTYLSYIGAFFGIVFFARRMLCTGPGRYRWCLLAALTLVLVSAALAHKQAGYWRDTITFFERESQINPNSPSAPIHVGQALLEQGKAGEALKQFERSLELDSGKAKAHALKADALRELGRVEEAVPIYRYAIEKMVDRADVYVQLGILLLNRGDNEGAVAVMGDGLNRYPEDVYLLNHMAHNFGFTQGRVELSRDYYGRALGEDPDNVHALLGLGILDLRENKLKEGIDKLERVLELDPENEPAHDAIRTYYRK